MSNVVGSAVGAGCYAANTGSIDDNESIIAQEAVSSGIATNAVERA